jgi:GNAT superfamily N-acetyltransferase
VNGWPSPLLAAQAEYLEHLGTTPSAEVRRDGGVYAVCTGAASNTENGVLGDDAAQVEELVAWFRDRKAPATWLCRDDSAAETLVAAGCRPERESWEMRARLRDLELRAAPTGVERVRSVEGVATWFDLAERNGWFGDSSERAPFERLYGELALRDGARVALYLKRVDGEAVAFASAFYGESTVLLTQVVVVDALQRRGIGSALAYTRLREAKERGCELAVLAPAPDGVPFYTALGFELHRSPPDRWFYLPCGPS